MTGGGVISGSVAPHLGDWVESVAVCNMSGHLLFASAHLMFSLNFRHFVICLSFSLHRIYFLPPPPSPPPSLSQSTAGHQRMRASVR